jgi:hypothetical protein
MPETRSLHRFVTGHTMGEAVQHSPQSEARESRGAPMILTSPSRDVDQAPPVTTTFDAPEDRRVTGLSGRTRRDSIDWERVERLHSFVKARAVERLGDAEKRQDRDAFEAERQNVHAIDAIFTQARRRRGVVAACAITFFRARAMRDAHHADFLGEWLGTAQHSRSA